MVDPGYLLVFFAHAFGVLGVAAAVVIGWLIIRDS